jgi:tetratricopeptide (TPR) repeat protein
MHVSPLDRAAGAYARTIRTSRGFALVGFAVVVVGITFAVLPMPRLVKLLAIATPAIAALALSEYSFGRVKQLLRRSHEAFERGDADALESYRRALYGSGEPDPGIVDNWRVRLSEEHLVRERWAEARDVLARIDRQKLPLASRPGVLNNLAYAMGLAGQPEEALVLAGQALQEAAALGDTYPEEKVAVLRGTRGILLSLAGRHDDAVAELAPLVDGGLGSTRARAARGYHHGASLRALGRMSDAAAAWEKAAREEGPWADRARTAAAQMTPHRS